MRKSGRHKKGIRTEKQSETVEALQKALVLPQMYDFQLSPWTLAHRHAMLAAMRGFSDGARMEKVPLPS